MKVGDIVTDFELPDHHGTQRRLSDLLAGGPVVLFFYPAALSRGCTAEVCHFRDLAAEFAAAGARPVGVSADDVDRQRQFAETNDVGFLLLSDERRTVAGQFGVTRRLSALPLKRHTFVVRTDRRIAEVIRSEFSMEAHADKALAALRSRKLA